MKVTFHGATHANKLLPSGRRKEPQDSARLCRANLTTQESGTRTFRATQSHADPVDIGFRPAQRIRDFAITLAVGTHLADNLGVLVMFTSDSWAAKLLPFGTCMGQNLP